MPVITQKRIYRSDLKANPDTLYVFGDNMQRVGLGGQAGEMRGEPNAVGVATKVSPGCGPYDYFADDNNAPSYRTVMTTDLERVREHLRNGGLVVLPADGLGTGLSEMPKRCPQLFAYLEALIDRLVNSSAYPALPKPPPAKPYVSSIVTH